MVVFRIYQIDCSVLIKAQALPGYIMLGGKRETPMDLDT